MSANLAYVGLPSRKKTVGQINSTVALCWVNKPFKNWKTFISEFAGFMISMATSI